MGGGDSKKQQKARSIRTVSDGDSTAGADGGEAADFCLSEHRLAFEPTDLTAVRPGLPIQLKLGMPLSVEAAGAQIGIINDRAADGVEACMLAGHAMRGRIVSIHADGSSGTVRVRGAPA